MHLIIRQIPQKRHSFDRFTQVNHEYRGASEARVFEGSRSHFGRSRKISIRDDDTGGQAGSLHRRF